MSEQQEGTPLKEQIQIGVDQFGDPFVKLAIETPGATALSADACDQLALKLIAAAAAARVRATVIQRQLLTGAQPGDAVAFVNQLLGP